MKALRFPIQFKFKITTLANDFTATDTSGHTIAYVKQKLFKLKDEITIFSDERQVQIDYKINADRWIDFSAAYSFTDHTGKPVGKIARKGWRSIWKAEYELIDQHDELQFHIREENAWVKVMDGFLGEIPIVNFFTGYFFNPAYIVTDMSNREVARLQKEPSFWGRNFTVTKLSNTDEDDDERIILGLMMMILLERRKG